jgi:hypothetical protein
MTFLPFRKRPILTSARCQELDRDIQNRDLLKEKGDGRIIEHTANREKQEQCSERKKAVVGGAAGKPEQLFALDVSKSGQCRRQGVCIVLRP